ncbi:MAG: ATP-binding protein [Phycisphaerales bacterium]|nr:ATP-binding protein [Phycisphaerales bacterium]
MSVMESNPGPTPVADPPASLDAAELAGLVRSFNEVTARLEATHASLRSEVAGLKEELAEAHVRLERSRQLAALGEMAAGIAHEIRNPLGCIALNMEAITEDLAGQDAQIELCDRVSRAVTRLDAIVGDVLAFARDTRVKPVAQSPVDAVRSAVMSTADLLERAGIDLEFDFEEELMAEFDAALLEQAVLNVLRNACESMVEHQVGTPRLEVAVREDILRDAEDRAVSHVVVSVRDTGPGIPREIRERMFNPFFTTRGEGTGLGLAIVHRIVDAHGGQVVVGDADPGAIVALALPVEYAGAPAGDGQDGRNLDDAVRRRVRESADRGAA